ncbi:ABC1 kinase family protein [Ammoniphilus resinae]|uniref:Unusual protein kinase regulating ubiquinone biosynthesis (AarF/ABC1/UbiB family) n=1 Tax=Ammoniphilus resinae TaxID=861532 RepID=A0ABS4GM99_9BACL|nr:AarF/UbiB family protein [Ammoniphilus resinae]MBP1931388.1 putative unusual protein kinase regulating ubiquinone biosynthesis (AarF/ABC1/UbiB family) [Ammoniphilus resinae]
MKIKLIRRFFIIRLALSFIFDYWRIVFLKKRLEGDQLEEAVSRVSANAGKRMRNTAFRLEGIIVKVGQFLSTREDLLPKAFTEQLTDLQDTMPPVPFSKMKPYIEKQSNHRLDFIFGRFEENPVASASLAQVHKAILKDGSVVAVKVIRPNIEKIAKADLDSLGLMAKITKLFPSLRRKMNFVQLHQEFSETILRELDCRQELIHLQRFAAMFANDLRIKIPYAYVEYTTERILVMEFIEGTRVTELPKLHSLEVDATAIAKTLLEAYFLQLFVYGFIHVDPHPGNLLILSNHQICFLDFGMVDELDSEEVTLFRRLFQSILLGDLNVIMSTLKQLGFVTQQANQEAVRSVIRHMLDRFSDVDHPSDATIGLASLLRNNDLQLQAKYMFLLRSVGFMLSTLKRLAPNIPIFELLIQVGPVVFSRVREK